MSDTEKIAEVVAQVADKLKHVTNEDDRTVVVVPVIVINSGQVRIEREIDR